jgi:hypothetical protein
MNPNWLASVLRAYGPDSHEGRVARAVVECAATNPNYAEFMVHDIGDRCRLGERGARSALDKLKGAGFIKPLLSGSLVHTVKLVTPEYSVPKPDKPKAPRFGDGWSEFLSDRHEISDRDERNA